MTWIIQGIIRVHVFIELQKGLSYTSQIVMPTKVNDSTVLQLTEICHTFTERFVRLSVRIM